MHSFLKTQKHCSNPAALSTDCVQQNMLSLIVFLFPCLFYVLFSLVLSLVVLGDNFVDSGSPSASSVVDNYFHIVLDC